MQFAEWLEKREAITEGVGLVNHPLTQKVIGFIQKYLNAAGAEAGDLRTAALVVRARLKSLLGDSSERPTEDQMKMALGTILRMPKLGTMLLPLVSPIPGTFLTLLILNVALRKTLGVSILPRHFEAAFSGPGTMVGRLVGGGRRV